MIYGSSAVRAVIFDLDGVVRYWDPAIMEDAERSAGLPSGSLARAVLDDGELLRLAVTGAITDEQWRAEIAGRLQTMYGMSAAVAVQTWSSSPGEVATQVLELVRWTREHTRVALLSNATTRLVSDLEHLGILEEFDDVFNTSDLGVAKPDAAVFQRVCDDLGVATHECVFVDDSPRHVQAANGIGIHAHHFVSVEELRDFLTELPFA